jgi:hypothetical protein
LLVFFPMHQNGVCFIREGAHAEHYCLWVVGSAGWI